MMKTLVRFLPLVLLAGGPISYADASYQQVTQVTGGQLIDSLKNMPFIGKQIKQLTAPTSTITMVHGNQKAVVGADSTEITDLDKEVIIHIDTAKKTYSVVTFADMRKMVAEMPEKMAEMQKKMDEAQQQAKAQQAQGQQIPANLKFDFTTNVNDTGLTKVVNGKDCKQQILTLKMTVTDTDPAAGTTASGSGSAASSPTATGPSGAPVSVAYSMTTEIWTTPDVPDEMKEVQDFDMRFGKKLMEGADLSAYKNMFAANRNNNSGMAMLFNGKPGAADAFAQMGKEMAKIKGTRILEITRMGGTGTGIAGAPNGQSAPPPPSGSSVAGQVATDTATQTAAGESGRLGIPGSALAGSLIGAFHKKKATPPPAPAPAATTTTATTTTTTDVTLMEMTTQTNNFSRETAPSSFFEVPAGYSKVPSPYEQMMKSK